MKKGLKNNILALSLACLALAILTISCFFANAPLLLPATLIAITAMLVVRLIKVIDKQRLEYLDGPRRYCSGCGIEIGSGGRHEVSGSLLVDITDDFSHATPYKVDYIADAHDLPKIENSSMDYVCASHVLEHLTNPIKAILEWLRILKPAGILWLRIPDKRKTFDRNRQRTTLLHLVEDFEKHVPVDDPTHIEDNNLNTDPPRDQAHPYIHNHVWIPEDIRQLFDHIRSKHVPLSIIDLKESRRKNAEDFYVVIRKSDR